MSDPYLRADRRARRNRVRHGGLTGQFRAWGVPLLTAALLTPLIQRVFLPFLEGPSATWAEGTER
ncbi:MAG: hypothetical protein AAGA48_40820, partial [Myxococcota bacterium]